MFYIAIVILGIMMIILKMIIILANQDHNSGKLQPKVESLARLVAGLHLLDTKVHHHHVQHQHHHHHPCMIIIINVIILF